MPIVLSYTREKDFKMKEKGGALLGSSTDKDGTEVHVWFINDQLTSEPVQVEIYNDGKGRKQSTRVRIAGNLDYQGYGWDFKEALQDLQASYTGDMFKMLSVSCNMADGNFETFSADHLGNKLEK